jgi:subtilase family serine protease
MKKRIVFSALFIQIILASFVFAQSSQITNGLNYLSSTQNEAGFWASENELTLTTAEVIKTLRLLNQANTSTYTLALTWLQNQQLETTNNLAERIYILAAGGADSSLLVSYMYAALRAWGGYNDFTVNNLDTALALQALRSINYADQTVIQAAINYLLTNQNTDGGWGFYKDDTSNVYMTAIIVNTLSQFKTVYNLQNQINKAAAYLLTNQYEDGGFGSYESTVYETALALEALVAGGINFASASQPAINYLAANQLADGSWNDDAYSTAIALRAFTKFKPDMVITTADITFSKLAPVAGDTIDITANVVNSGPARAENVLVRFYLGDPEQGGILIGEAVISYIDAFGNAQVTITWTIPATFSGSGKIFVVVNPLNSIDELDNSNGSASKNLTPSTLPDLSISSSDISLNPEYPCAGKAVLITATVRNEGETATSNVSVDFYDGDPNSGGTAIGSAVISAIGAGASASAAISSSFNTGEHAIYVVVDKTNLITEGSKSNNTANKTLSIDESDIDLAIDKNDISFNPISPKDGDDVTINATIRNLGEGTANTVSVNFYLNDPKSGGILIGSKSIPSVPGRGTADISITWNSEGYAGKNDIYVLVDPQNLICDASRLNNENYQTLIILGNSGADLSVSAGDIHIAPAQPNAGDQAAVSVTVYNGGTQGAVNVPVEISLGDPRLGGTLIFGTHTIPSIPVGGSATVQATLNTTGYAGVYEIYVNVDPFGTIVETNKSNNMAYAAIAIKASTAPDITVANIDTAGVSTDSQTLTMAGTIAVTITNNGKSDVTGPFDITAFEDTDKNKKFDPVIDKVFGQVTYSGNLAAGASDTVNMAVSGTVLFKGNLLYAFADSANVIAELNETNNIRNTGQQCETEPQVGTFNPVEKWSWTGGTTMPTYNQVMVMPVVARISDTNGDNVIDDEDVPAIIFNSFAGKNWDSGILRAIRGDNGEEIFSLSDSAYRINTPTQIAVGDIDNDGFMEILASASDHRILCFEHTGTLKWKSPVINPTGTQVYGRGITIADIDNSGQPKIILGRTVLNNNGAILWQGTGGMGNGYAGPLSLVADINLDGIPEIVAGNTVYRNNGTILWQNTSLPDGLNAVGKFYSDDPYPQIALVRNGNVYLLNHLGQIKWGPKAIPGGGNGGPPVVADFDGDGIPEIGVASYSRYVVFKANGTILWQSVTQDYSSSATGSSVFDFEGDGKAEVLYNDELYFRIYNGGDGRKLFEIKNSSMTVYEYPVIADVNNDGHTEIVIAANNYGTSGSTTYGIRVFGDANNSWVNTRQIWNQHTYHITNVNDDGTIPRIEQNNWDIYNNYRCNVLTKSNALSTPDVTVSYLTVDNSNFPNTVSLSARIGNGGAISLPAGIEITFYDGDPVSGGILIGTANTAKEISSGSYEDVSITWNNPVAGAHNVFAVADGNNLIKECLKNNNIANAVLTLQSKVPPTTNLPDLTLSPADIVITPPNPIDGQPAIINATIHNIGTLNVSNIVVSFYDGDPQKGGTLIGSSTIPNITAGATALTSVIWNTYSQSGRNYIHVVIDPQNLITELKENNNSSLISTDVAIPTKPDLAITNSDITFSNNTPKEGEVLTISAVVHNLGVSISNVEVSLYDGNPSAGGTIISQQVIQKVISAGGKVSLNFEVNTLGLSNTKTYFISLDPANKIAEVSESNNIACGTVSIMSSNLNMSISTDKTNYTADEDVQITVKVSNLSSSTKSELLDVQITDGNNNIVGNVISGVQIDLGPNENKTFNYEWNTGANYTGNYKAVALLLETGNVVSKAETAFVVNTVKSVSSNITTDKMSYNANEAVTITSSIQNTASNVNLNNLTAQITVIGSGGIALFAETKTIPILTPGQLTQLKTYWNTGITPAGSYTVRLDVLDGTNLLSTSMAGFAIQGTDVSPKLPGIQGTITATPISVYQGKDVSLGYTITNNGNADIPLLNIKIIVVDPVTEEIKAEFDNQQEIPQGNSIIGIGLNSVSTSSWSPGTYIAILRAATPTMTEFATLSKANFEVKAGIQATKSIPDAANLLVWVNKNCKIPKDNKNIGANCVIDHGKDCMRIDLLEKALKAAAVNYLIVYDNDDFQKQVRNPYFTDYMILGDHHPLTNHFADELREHVYSGKGLISSLFIRDGEPGTELLGIKFKGHLPSNNHEVDFVSSPISPDGELKAEGKAIKSEILDGAILGGWIRPIGYPRINKHHKCLPKCKEEHNPAVVLNNYGNGKTVFYAFDLGATLDDTNYSQIAALIKNSIVHVHKPLDNASSFMPGQFVPVEIKIQSLGGSFDLKVKETYPAQLKIFDPSTNKWVKDNPWLKDISIDSNETKYLRFYVLTPDTPGTYKLETEIGYFENGEFKVHSNLSIDIMVGKDKTVMVNDIIDALKALPVTAKDKFEVLKAINYIEDVKHSHRYGSSKVALEKNIHDILKAIDEIIDITSCDTLEVRTMMDMLLRFYEAKFYFS